VNEILRIRIEGCRPSFAPRARYVLETLAEALGAGASWTEGEADVVYAPERPADGVWIPADDRAQAFFEGTDPFPSRAVHRARGMSLLFPPTHPSEPLPGDLVASAFHLLSRWDERHVPVRDRFGRLPLAAGSFGQIAGLSLDEPAIEGYRRVRAALRHPPAARGASARPRLDGRRMRPPRSGAPRAPAGGAGRWPARCSAPDRGHLPDVLETTWRAGCAPPVFMRARWTGPPSGEAGACAPAQGGGPRGLARAAEDCGALPRSCRLSRGDARQGVHCPRCAWSSRTRCAGSGPAAPQYLCDARSARPRLRDGPRRPHVRISWRPSGG